jgi:hypothetical protein
MLIEAVKNGRKTRHTADLAVDIRSEGSVMIQLKSDARLLSKIAKDFEGAEEIVSEDGRSWAGYGDVIVLYRMDGETVQIRVKRSEGA